MTSDQVLSLAVLIHLRQALKGRDADDPPMGVWLSLAVFTAESTVMEEAEPTLVAGGAELRCPPGPLRAYRLVAHVGKVQRPVVERLPVMVGVSGSVQVTRAALIDTTGDTLETLPIVDLMSPAGCVVGRAEPLARSPSCQLRCRIAYRARALTGASKLLRGASISTSSMSTST